MAFTTEFILGAGGTGPVDFPVGTINDTDPVVHSFSLAAPSLVAVSMPGITGPSPTTRWGASAPTITIAPVGQSISYGVNYFRTSLVVSAASTGIPVNEQIGGGNAHLSICVSLPAGAFQVRVRTYGSSRSYSLGIGKILIVPA